MSAHSVSDFLEILARGLRRPLEPAKAAAEELRMTAADPNSQRSGEIILGQVSQMERIIDALLDLSLLESGRFEALRSLVDLEQVLATAVEECRPALEAKSQRLMVQMPDEWPQVEGDETRLVQIVRNLLDNAVKFTPEGGSIYLAIAAAGSHVDIQVRDDGCGFTAALLPDIFQAFAVPASECHAEAGLGLGLSITKHLVELHNGTIAASSPGPGQGSEFHVSLPVAGR